MSIRIIGCFLSVFGFSVYAYRNWFVSLCAAIVLMAFFQHPDMPHAIAGIQGLNPWNVLMLNVMLAWWRDRRREGLSWDLPRYVYLLGIAFLSVIVWSYLRLVTDSDSVGALNSELMDLQGDVYSFTAMTSEYLINCVKYVIPGILLFDACRSRRRATVALGMLLLLYFLLSIQVIKHMPLSSLTASGSEFAKKSSKLLHDNVGYHRIELSMMCAGASWAILTFMLLARTGRQRFLLIGASLVVSLAQALTGGRAGYVTWGLTGLVLAILRWRWILLWMIALLIVVSATMPGVTQRMLQGFGGQRGDIVVETSDDEITAGRTVAWAHVIPKIEESPMCGYGRQAMITTGISRMMRDRYGESETFPHPHNAYLEILLDDGLIGFVLVMPIYFVMLFQSLRLTVDRSDPLFGAAGGMAAALILALLIAAMGAESFYPKESSVGMWGAIGVMMRVLVERKRSRYTGQPLFAEDDFAVPEFASVEAPLQEATLRTGAV